MASSHSMALYHRRTYFAWDKYSLKSSAIFTKFVHAKYPDCHALRTTCCSTAVCHCFGTWSRSTETFLKPLSASCDVPPPAIGKRTQMSCLSRNGTPARGRELRDRTVGLQLSSEHRLTSTRVRLGILQLRGGPLRIEQASERVHSVFFFSAVHTPW